jgi:hypothetical protein
LEYSSNDSNVSPDGSCGGEAGYTCTGSDFGECCSKHGYCGSTKKNCGRGCQDAFGWCKRSPKADAPAASDLPEKSDGISENTGAPKSSESVGNGEYLPEETASLTKALSATLEVSRSSQYDDFGNKTVEASPSTTAQNSASKTILSKSSEVVTSTFNPLDDSVPSAFDIGSFENFPSYTMEYGLAETLGSFAAIQSDASSIDPKPQVGVSEVLGLAQTPSATNSGPPSTEKATCIVPTCPYTENPTCGGDHGSCYVADQRTFSITCGGLASGDFIQPAPATNIGECITQCSKVPNCVAISFYSGVTTSCSLFATFTETYYNSAGGMKANAVLIKNICW